MQCPINIKQYPNVILAHGGGGKLMGQLINSMFRKAFKHVQEHDGARLPSKIDDIVMTTDTFVVNPIFFPGGDIGKLAIAGTVNDVAMCGAVPKYISVGFIIEEGMTMDDLWHIVQSMAKEAELAGVEIVTGDTKVVEKGKGDKIFINTTGIGWMVEGADVSPRNIQNGDAIILSGDLGRHGTAILTVREGLQFESELQSDCACLHKPIIELLQSGLSVKCMRDVTRGGLNSVLNELAISANHQLEIKESAIHISNEVETLCEILGLDPLSSACEGRFVLFVAKDDVSNVIRILKQFQETADAHVIGSATQFSEPRVIIQTRLNTKRILDQPIGEQLPRIC